MRSGLSNGLLHGVATLAVCAAITFAVSTSAVAKPELDHLKVRLDWTPWGVHGAFFLAKVKGWYKDAGLSVDFEDGNGSVTTIQIVGTSDDFDVGHASLGSMMIARDKGLPVKAVAPFAIKSDIGVLVPENTKIKGPSGLKGLKIVYTAGSLEAPFIDDFLAAGGLDRGDVSLLNVNAASKATTYAVGRADAVISTIPFILYSVNVRRPSRVLLFSDYGLNMPSFGIFASEHKLETKSDQISRFASVTARAWQYIFNGHRDEAVKAIMTERPYSNLNARTLRGQIDSLYTFFGKPKKGDRIGIPDPESWKGALGVLKAAGLISGDETAADFYVTGMVHPAQYDKMVAQ